MNTYVTLACLLAVVGLSHGSAIGYGWGAPWGHGVIGAPLLAPAAVSTQNLVKAAPIPVIRTIAAPIYTAPVIKTVPIIKTVAPISTLGLGWDGLGYGYGLGGLDGLGLGAKGLGLGWGNPWVGGLIKH